MDILWSKDQIEQYEYIVQNTQNYAAQQKREESPYWTRSQWQHCGKLGLLGLSVPKSYGGQGLGALETAHMLEAFGYSCPDMGLVFSIAAHLFACCMPLAEQSNTLLQEHVLPDLCSGKLIGANAITERDAGSDVFAMKTVAKRDGDAYVLNGMKSYVSNGPVADIFIVYAVTNAHHGYFGISSFLVHRTTPGLSLGEPFQKMGLTSTPACQVSLKDCRVPITQRLGEEGQGAPIFTQSMQWERACLFAGYVGMMERQLEQVIHYAQKRQQFGKAIGQNQAISHRIVEMKLRLESARLLLYRACSLFERGEHSQVAISLSKLAISEAAIANSLDAIQIHGSEGIDCKYGIESMLRDAIPSTIFSGTSEMQHEIIAKELGL
jgi:alkylation response protein AidB-like acyl-CoA dehydrogenase